MRKICLCSFQMLTISQALPRPSLKAIQDSAASYLITGGTGGLGRSITRWLARQGATNIILASRSGMDQKGIGELVDDLRALEVNLVVRKCAIAIPAQVEDLIAECRSTMPPIKGVIHGAMALRDALFEKTSFQDWETNIKPRVQGAWNLHHSLAGDKLDFFVLLASGSGIIGNAGQAAYAASNTFLDAFASYRSELGQPTTAIDIGIVESVGYVAENPDRQAEIAQVAHDRLSEDELLALIKAAITGAFSDNHSEQTITGCKLLPNKPLPPWTADPKFAHVLLGTLSSTPAGDSSGESIAVRHLLRQTTSLQEAEQVICAALVQKLATLLLMAVEDIDSKKPVVAYGLDSLVAVEFRNWITLELDANVPLMELMNCPSVEGLAGKIAGKSGCVADGMNGRGGKEGQQE